jgi:hypothetical protein
VISVKTLNALKVKRARNSNVLRQMKLDKDATVSNWMKVRKLLRESKLKRILSSGFTEASTDDEYSHPTNMECDQTSEVAVEDVMQNESHQKINAFDFVPIDYLPDFSRLITA